LVSGLIISRAACRLPRTNSSASFAHFTRNQLDHGRLSLRVARREDRDDPAIDISLSSEEDLRELVSADAVSELAQSFGVVATDMGSTDKELHLSVALENFARF